MSRLVLEEVPLVVEDERAGLCLTVEAERMLGDARETIPCPLQGWHGGGDG